MDAHYLPRGYLKGFVDPTSDQREPFLWVRDSNTRAWRARAPKNVATKRDYSAISRRDGVKDQIIENTLGTLESHVSPILRKLPFQDDLTEDETSALVVFASTMFVRLPLVHDAVDRDFAGPHVKQTLLRHYQKLREDPEAFQRSLEAVARETGNARMLDLKIEDLISHIEHVELRRDFLIGRLFQATLPSLTDLFSGMRWRLFRAPSSAFLITSDRPIMVLDPTAPARLTHSLESPGAMLTLPLTREILLTGDWRGPPSMSWATASAALVEDANLRVIGPGLNLYSPTREFPGHQKFLELERDHARRIP